MFLFIKKSYVSRVDVMSCLHELSLYYALRHGPLAPMDILNLDIRFTQDIGLKSDISEVVFVLGIKVRKV